MTRGDQFPDAGYHRGYVQTACSGQAFFAVCPACGMLPTPDRATRDEAWRDVDDHYASRLALSADLPREAPR